MVCGVGVCCSLVVRWCVGAPPYSNRVLSRLTARVGGRGPIVEAEGMFVTIYYCTRLSRDIRTYFNMFSYI